MECVSTSNVSVLVKGSPKDEFILDKGRRRGYPLSHFLFLLTKEDFNVMSNFSVEVGICLGYDVGS